MLLPRIRPKTQSGCEPFTSGGEKLGPTLLEYWRWSGSNLVNNVERGVLAEFLVTNALGVTREPREEWGGFDIEVPDCGTVEVKSAAYIQSWKQCGFSKIGFDIRKRKFAWNPATEEEMTLDPPQRVADVYVFCLLKHKCQETINPLDVRQWGFYVVRRSKLDRSEWRNNKRIGLRSVAGLAKKAIPYAGLNDAVLRAIRREKRVKAP